ncbi:hypothetical protein [Streptomyces sp. NPDC002205]|uniref:hypothetical protein n=1 Tax=Streptomyces sp. NPDC002205 TaxID=3154411 RepID=UPI00332290FC
MLVRNAYPPVLTDGGGGPGGDTTAPTGPKAPAKTAPSVSLSWTASPDDTGVSGYDLYRDGTKVTAAPVAGTASRTRGSARAPRTASPSAPVTTPGTSRRLPPR